MIVLLLALGLFFSNCFQVITCEENGGYYEFAFAAALEANNSVLMWNHPGFCCIAGLPWPSEEAAAVDIVVQFAFTDLGWDEEDIVVYGWSIGGFTATWAAMNYTNIRGLILDTTFDDALQLATTYSRFSSPSLSERVVRRYINMEIGKQLAHFDGLVLVIRRRKNEIMTAPFRITNRTDHLLRDLLKTRYPNVFRDDIDPVIGQWLEVTEAQRPLILAGFAVVGDEWHEILREYVEENGENEHVVFRMLIGSTYDFEKRPKLALYLLSKYLIEYDSRHGSPLPSTLFYIPKRPWAS